jgi:signal transduction histidine kinase/PAS domain-containing protein
VIEFAAGFCVFVVVTLAGLLLRTKAKLRKMRSAAAGYERGRAEALAVLDTVPLAAFRWPAGDDDGYPVQTVAYPKFVAELAAGDAAQLEAARQLLQRDGIAFSLPVRLGGGGVFVIEGRRAASGETVLWLLDGGPAALARQAGAEAANLREMFDAIPVPMWRRGRDRALVECNNAYAAALDAPRALVLAEGRELAPADGLEKALEFATDPDRRNSHRHVVIGGSRRLLDIVELPCADGGVIGFAVDRTDVENVETDLRRHVAAHAEVLENIGAAVAIYGADQRLKFFNAAFATLWGLETDWLATEPSFGDLLERLRERRRIPEHADFRAFKRQRLQLFTSLIHRQQELMHLPDERTLLLSMSPHPLGGLTFVYENVTDRLALERSCNTLTQVRRATLDNLFEGVAVYGSDGRLKLHNPAYLNIWGLSQDDVAGEPHIGEMVEKMGVFLDDGEEWAATKQGIIARVTTHAATSGTLHRSDGSMLQVATVPLPDGNVLLTYLDVTDTARVERALRERNEALETAGRLKSEFIANVSHELRTPLNAVIGFAEILVNQYFGPLNPRQLDYSNSILASARLLMRLINDILDLATIEAGYMVLETSPIDVSAMLHSVLALTRERARSRDLELDLRCPPEIGVVEGDERRLKQALFNLISNAVKFTPPGGAIRLEATRRDDALLMTVADTGVGIPFADQARVFEKFERGVRQPGAGLGLSLVKSLIELHGGTVVIESVSGQGTRITCRLPVAQPTTTAPAALAYRAEPLALAAPAS